MRQLIEKLSPPPKLQGRRARTRKAESSVVVTSSPFEQAVMLKEAGGTKNKPKHTSEGKSKVSDTKGKAPAPKERKRKRLEHKSDEDDSEEDVSWPCLICGETYSRSRERWIQCIECTHWAHEDCTDGGDFFVCPNCESDDDL